MRDKNKMNTLWPEDERLFEDMKGKYQSENEKRFFEEMYDRETNDDSLLGDLLMHEDDNEDDIFIFRIFYEEYRFGRYHSKVKSQHVMNLSEALTTNLREAGYIQQDLTLLEWLRARDYRGIRYDMNYDDKEFIKK